MSCVQVWCRLKPQGSTGAAPPVVYTAGSSGVCVEVAGPQQPGQGQGQGQGYRLQFELDHVFDSASTQEDIFEQLRPRVREFLQGYSATVLTYGQTGSGKTFTIQGAEAVAGAGIVPRVADMIFAHCNEDIATGSVEVYISFLEIYQEKLKDLLQRDQNRSSSARGLRIRETAKSGVWVEGLTEQRIASTAEFADLFRASSQRRAVGAHAMNAESSRSHVCCTILMKQTEEGLGGRCCKFHLVDLAGSEMVRKTDASGVRLNEAKHINKSLSALGNVIAALTGAGDSDVVTAKRHVPYRDSKLTRILQDSLAGNSKTTLVLTASSSVNSVHETIATLRFGERARKLTTKPRLNLTVDQRESNGKDLSEEISRLRLALQHAQHEIMRLSEIIAESGTSPSNIVGVADDRSDLSTSCTQCGGRVPSQPASDVYWSGGSDCVPDGDNKSAASSADGKNEVDAVRVLEPDFPSTLSRCAVCGLSEAEGDSLDNSIFSVDGVQSSGVCPSEGMGALFTCDGNCGHYFHHRCVGMTSYQDGEWFCIDCSNIMHTEEQENDVDNDKFVSPSAESMLSRITRQYHVMRLERNRLMLNWQQERKMAKLRASKELLHQQRLDQEQQATIEYNDLLKEQLHQAHLENDRLRKSRDHEFNLRVLIQKESPVGTRLNGRTETQVNSPTGVKVVQTTQLLTSNSLKETSSVRSLSAHVLAASAESSTEPISEDIGIPKPWLLQKRLSAVNRDLNTELDLKPLAVGGKSSFLNFPDDDRGRSERTCHTAADMREQRLFQVSPIRQTAEVQSQSDLVNRSKCTDISTEDKSATLLFPIRNRLKDLLKSVELEAGSFAEIRTKQKERESLRSSHVSRRERSIVPVPEGRFVEERVQHQSPNVQIVEVGESSKDKSIFRTFAPTRRKKTTDKVRIEPLNIVGTVENKVLSSTLPTIGSNR